MMSVSASNAAWLAPGCRLDRYDLLLQVAEGGMGLLWLARQQGKHGFDKIVAIKTILPKLASDASFRRMFLDEARVVSRIEHPNVAQVLDLGEEQGVLFLVMKWIDGESLINLGRAVASRTDSPIPVGILARIMVDACAGLHAAHELTDDDGQALGVVHRDVSPHNLLVGFRGATKVIDFGIAKARNRMAQDTSVGLLKGKIAYMAPEQAMGNEVDRRTDVWSAGACMYRFLAGRVPYSASEPLAVLRRITEGLPPAPLPLTVPAPIRVVVEKALEPDARRRFDSARDLAAALEEAMREADVGTTREDVAAFMGEHLGDARAMRTREIEHAVRESRARMRVELAQTESTSGLALPIAQRDPVGELPETPAEWSDKSIFVESASDKPPRPSRFPTVVLPASEVSAGATGGARAPPAVIDAIRPSVEMRAASTASVSAAPRARRRTSLPLAQWATAAGLLVLLLAGGVAWRASSRSRPIGATNLAVSPAPLPRAPDTSMVAPSEIASVQTTASAPDPPALASASAHPSDPRAPATPVVGPNVTDRGAAGDLLERAHRARRAGRIGEAAALFAAAVEGAPADFDALTGLAEVAEAQGAMAKAIVTFRRALAVNPRYLPARLGLADSLWTSGQRGEATSVYRSIVDQVPTNLCPDIARERAAENAGNEKTPR